jgi:hypothetical protein
MTIYSNFNEYKKLNMFCGIFINLSEQLNMDGQTRTYLQKQWEKCL